MKISYFCAVKNVDQIFFAELSELFSFRGQKLAQKLETKKMLRKVKKMIFSPISCKIGEILTDYNLYDCFPYLEDQVFPTLWM